MVSCRHFGVPGLLTFPGEIMIRLLLDNHSHFQFDGVIRNFARHALPLSGTRRFAAQSELLAERFPAASQDAW
jgi:hypothetical protein